VRLTPYQLEQIQHSAHDAVDGVLSDWQLWLFGSRMNDEARGGDVDLCVLSSASVQDLLSLKLKLRPAIEEALDIPVDLVMQSSTQPLKLVTQQAMHTGIRLI
jgi:predicted nucleotidyltransferase